MTKKQLVIDVIRATLIGGSAGSTFVNIEVNVENADRFGYANHFFKNI